VGLQGFLHYFLVIQLIEYVDYDLCVIEGDALRSEFSLEGCVSVRVN